MGEAGKMGFLLCVKPRLVIEPQIHNRAKKSLKSILSNLLVQRVEVRP